MNSIQMDCLQKLINALQECESVGVSFSHSYLRLDVEYEESHYLENLSANKLSELLNFIDGCGVFKSNESPVEPENLPTPDVLVGYDDGSRVGDYSCTIEIKDGVVTKWQIGE